MGQRELGWGHKCITLFGRGSGEDKLCSVNYWQMEIIATYFDLERVVDRRDLRGVFTKSFLWYFYDESNQLCDTDNQKYCTWTGGACSEPLSRRVVLLHLVLSDAESRRPRPPNIPPPGGEGSRGWRPRCDRSCARSSLQALLVI